MNSGSSSSTPIKKTATPRAPRTPASGRGRTKAASTKKASDADTSSDDNGDDESATSPSVGRKRGRTSAAPKSYAESDATTGDEKEFTPVNKKVKVEPVEEEGVAGIASTTDPLEEEDEGVAFV